MHWSTLLINIYHGCSVEVWPKVWVHKLSRIVTSLKSAVRSSVKLQRTFKSLSNLTACVCQNCKGQQPPPSSVPLFPCSKSNMSNYYLWNMICIRPGSFLGPRAKPVTHFWTNKGLYNEALALHLKVLFFLLYNDDMVPFRPLFSPYNYLYRYTTN